ncbi:hypothetical protein E3N88_37880 [Mikania micrantha]|uniref:Uncharacterized protein n=1 Tax=Mikania micrantha TaxID=192012 RepID=A0A5N6LSF6_9ASTR|nr:hypothetical protein E3N88_37880 [Mikania micrantha]
MNSQKADWDLATTLLNDEVIRQAAQNPQCSTVLVTPATQNSPAQAAPHPSHAPHQPDSTTQYHQPYYQSTFRGRGRGRNNYRGQGQGVTNSGEMNWKINVERPT